MRNILASLCLVLCLVLGACGNSSLTTIHVEVDSQAAWKVDQLHITIGTRAPISRPFEPVEIVVPDDMAGVATPIEISASSAEVTVASGKVDVTPVLRDDVFYTLTLQPLSCGTSCTLGAKMCDANGVSTCERQANGCGAWSQPTACSAPTPFCADGACTSSYEIQVTAGAFHSCATKSDGYVVCWGSNTYGQSTPPANVFRSIAAGWYYTCGLRVDGTIACWGETAMTTVPSGAFVKISTGAHHACAQRSDNTYACWGDATLSRYALPDAKYLGIAAGSEHTCAIRVDGTLACVGSNSYMQVSPVPAGTFAKIDGGDGHTCALRANGTAACWGYSVAIAGTPATAAFDAISVGSSNACALAGSALTCWGNNQYGQSSATPGQYRSVAAGARHACAVRTDKTIGCWGANTDGQSTPP
ncbi:MAG: hypothetical protein H0T65_22095 [Deltaproteobacteria bacterium]|nr:hypothetical protein [Deltaproteobacteria bacterium]